VFLFPYRYESFDFHAECRHLQWDRLSMLIDRLAHEQDEFGCFLLTRDGTLVSIQDGVFRTNCIDCLDRTNVVQSMLARRSLTQIMQVYTVATISYLNAFYPLCSKQLNKNTVYRHVTSIQQILSVPEYSIQCFQNKQKLSNGTKRAVVSSVISAGMLNRLNHSSRTQLVC